MIIGGGGIAAVLLVLYLHKRSTAQASQSAASVQQSSIPTASPISAQPDLGAYYSGTIPSAVGSSQTPSDSANSGSSATGGGFDISSLLGTLASGTVTNNASQIIANQHTADAAILAQMNVPVGGAVSVSHTSSGTTVSSSAPVDPNEAGLKGLYQSLFNRPADAGGLAYFENSMAHNPSVSLNDVANDMKNSSEYKAAHPNG